MNEDDFCTTDSELLADWIYYTVYANYNVDDFFECCDAVLETELTGTEIEINEAIENDLIFLEQDYKNGEISKDDYEREKIEITDRELVKKELMEVGEEIKATDCLAVAELLAALLDCETKAFEMFIKMNDSDFREHYISIKSRYDSDILIALVPKAIKLIEKYSNIESIKEFGLHDREAQKSWITSVKDLLSNLRKINS